jgi:hypothetical protein
MSHIRVETSDATELADLLTFLAAWLSSTQRHHLADSLTAFVGNKHYTITELVADLHRFVFLLGLSDGEDLFGEPSP